MSIQIKKRGNSKALGKSFKNSENCQCSKGIIVYVAITFFFGQFSFAQSSVENVGADSQTVVDIDGNVYKVVQIGNQLWMAENLKVTHYRNGDPIPNLADNDDWKNASSGAYSVYNNNPSNADVYGNLYNWYAINDERGLAPEGWHIPTDEEFKELEIHLGMSAMEANKSELRGTIEGGLLKEGGTKHWRRETCDDLVCPDGSEGCNCSGFTALPGGYRGFYGGDYGDMGWGAHFWTSTETGGNSASNRQLRDKTSKIYRFGMFNKKSGFSVRGVRD